MSQSLYLSIEDVAKRFDVNPTTIYRMVHRGELPGIKVGNQWRFREDALRHWEDEQMKRGQA